jgi:hypothetical protein
MKWRKNGIEHSYIGWGSIEAHNRGKNIRLWGNLSFDWRTLKNTNLEMLKELKSHEKNIKAGKRT